MAAAADDFELKIGKVVCPGDAVLQLPKSGQVVVGPGLHQKEGCLVASKVGVLQREPNTGKLWLQGRQKRYIPAAGEPVVGIILERHAENYTVDIGGPFQATLPTLAFEGATRRNRPNLQAGDLVYARVETAHRDADPVLSCTDAAGKASGFGPLVGGCTFQVSTRQARQLLAQKPSAPVLSALGAELQFEVAVGANGRVWVNAGSPGVAVLVATSIPLAEFMSEAQAVSLVKGRMKKVKSGAQHDVMDAD